MKEKKDYTMEDQIIVTTYHELMKDIEASNDYRMFVIRAKRIVEYVDDFSFFDGTGDKELIHRGITTGKSILDSPFSSVLPSSFLWNIMRAGILGSDAIKSTDTTQQQGLSCFSLGIFSTLYDKVIEEGYGEE